MSTDKQANGEHGGVMVVAGGGGGALTLILQSCISIMTSQPKADQNLREVGGEGRWVTNQKQKAEAVNAAGEIKYGIRVHSC